MADEGQAAHVLSTLHARLCMLLPVGSCEVWTDQQATLLLDASGCKHASDHIAAD